MHGALIAGKFFSHLKNDFKMTVPFNTSFRSTSHRRFTVKKKCAKIDPSLIFNYFLI